MSATQIIKPIKNNKNRPKKTQPKNQKPKPKAPAPANASSYGGNSQFANHIANYAHGAEEIAACQAYLNVGHGTNFSNARPLPDGTPGMVYLYKAQWTRDFTPAQLGNPAHQMTFSTVPSFEYPFMVSDGNTSVAYGIPNKKALAGNNSPMMYLKDNHVYAFRCLGKSMTMTDRTALIDRRGMIVAQHKQPDVDYMLQTLTDAPARNAISNERVLQRCPISAAQVSDLGSYYQAKVEDGFYVQAHHTSDNWTVRDRILNKISPTLVPPQGSADSQSHLMITKFADGAALTMYDMDTPTLHCLSSGCDNTDMAMAAIDGITSTTVVEVKFTVVYEFLLKPSSALYSDRVCRPLYNPSLMVMLRAYEAYRSQLPGGGTLLGRDNDWNSIWTGFKSFISKTKDFGHNLLANLGVHDAESAFKLIGKVAPFAMALI